MILDHQIEERKIVSDKHVSETHGEQSPETFLDLCLILAREKWFIVTVSVIAAAISAIWVVLTPNWFLATTVILPPAQAQSSASMMLGGQLGALSGLAGGSSLANSLGLKSPADLYVGVLQSRSIADVLVGRFD